jgi:hypothetical protein
VAYSQQLHNINSPLQSVFVHTVLGGGGPRRQPLNGSDRHALLARRQLESVLAGGNGDGGIQLRPDGGGAPPLGWEAAGGGDCGAAPVLDGDGLQICVICIRPFRTFGLFLSIFADSAIVA